MFHDTFDIEIAHIVNFIVKIIQIIRKHMDQWSRCGNSKPDIQLYFEIHLYSMLNTFKIYALEKREQLQCEHGKRSEQYAGIWYSNSYRVILIQYICM